MYCKNLLFILVGLTCLSVTMSRVIAAEPELDLAAKPTVFGLYPVEHPHLDRVYARPGAGLEFYQSIYLSPVDIYYRTQKDEHGVIEPSVSDLEGMQALSRYFYEALTRELPTTKYDLVDEPKLGTLSLRLTLTDLQPGAALHAHRDTDAFLGVVAKTNVVIELSDARTGELLVQLADRQIIGRAQLSLDKRALLSDEALIRAWVDEIVTQVAVGLNEVKTFRL